MTGHHYIWCLDQDTGKERHFEVPYSISVYIKQLENKAKEKPPEVKPGADRGGSSFYRGPMDVV